MNRPDPAAAARPRRTGARLTAAWVVLLGCAAGTAWLGAAAPGAAAPATLHAVLWGPLQETAWMLAATRVLAATLARSAGAARHGPSRTLCTGVIGMAFWLAHGSGAGVGSLPGLLMALLLAAIASRVSNEPAAWPSAAATMFGLHAAYNLGVLARAGVP